MVTETLALGTGSGAEATNPSTLAGVVTPAPVAKMLTQSPRAAGFAAEFTLPSLVFRIAPGPWPEPSMLKIARCGGGNLQRHRIRQHAQVLQLKLGCGLSGDGIRNHYVHLSGGRVQQRRRHAIKIHLHAFERVGHQARICQGKQGGRGRTDGRTEQRHDLSGSHGTGLKRRAVHHARPRQAGRRIGKTQQRRAVTGNRHLHLRGGSERLKHGTAQRGCGVERDQRGGRERAESGQIEREGARNSRAVVIRIDLLDRVIGHQNHHRSIRIAQRQRVGIQTVHRAGVIDPKATARRSGLKYVLTRRRRQPVRKIIVDPIAEIGIARRIGLAILRVGRKIPMVERLRAGLPEHLKHQRTPGGEERTGAARIQNERRAIAIAQAIIQSVVGVDVVLSDPNRHAGEVRLSGKLRVNVS